MYQFTPASAHSWKSGDLFLGRDENGNAVGISTERHAITIAGSQSGKGVGVIIPNLLRWPHNTLTIDPKGEAAAATVEARQAMGLPSFVFAPFAKTIKVNVPDHLLVTINPLENLNPESFTITEDSRASAMLIVLVGAGAKPLALGLRNCCYSAVGHLTSPKGPATWGLSVNGDGNEIEK